MTNAYVVLDTVLRAEQRHTVAVDKRDDTRMRVTLAFDAEIGHIELGHRIRELRRECGIRLEPFAKLIGITDGFLSRIELGDSPTVNLRILLAICDVCSFDIGRLLSPTWLGAKGAHITALEAVSA